MIQTDADHHRHRGIDDVDGVKTPSHAHLEHPRVDLGGLKDQECRERVVLEERQGHFAGSRGAETRDAGRDHVGRCGVARGCAAVGPARPHARRFDPFERRDQLFVRDQPVMDANALAIIAQVGRCERAHPVAGRTQDGGAIGGDRSLAVGARDRDHRHRRLPPVQAFQYFPKARETEIDRLRVHL